jgi:hypothetical protein
MRKSLCRQTIMIIIIIMTSVFMRGCIGKRENTHTKNHKRKKTIQLKLIELIRENIY